MSYAFKTGKRDDQLTPKTSDTVGAEGSVFTRFVRMGEAEELLAVSHGTTVGDLLAHRGLDPNTGEVFYNLTRTDLGTIVEPDSLVVYTSKIRGGAGTPKQGY